MPGTLALALIHRRTSFGPPGGAARWRQRGSTSDRWSSACHRPVAGAGCGGVEGLMTANKNFKRRVRDRARRTGESYTAALRHLRQLDVKEPTVQWQRIEKTDFGYAISVPAGWTERPPDLKNSPLETARFGEETDRRHG